MKKNSKFARFKFLFKMRYTLSTLLLFLVFVSCTKKQDNVIISKNFVNEEWSRFEYLNGNINISKVPAKCDIIMEVVVSEVFPNVYENHKDDCSLSFNMTIKYPNNSGARSNNYSYSLKDRDGNWKADKKEGYYTFKLPIISEISLGEEGVYDIKLENKYPKDPLYGIKSLTLKYVTSK